MTRYTVVGAGAVGLLYGGRLQEAGHDLTWVLPSAADEIGAKGIRIEAGGKTTGLEARVVADPADAPPADVVLVALKATANDRLDELVAPAIADGSTVALFQNGLGGEERVREAVPPAGPIVGALCFVCAHRRSPGRVEHLDYGSVELAELGAASVTSSVAGLASDLRGAGFEVTETPDLATARWRKLVWNIPFNGLAVVLDAGTDELMADEASCGLVRMLMGEVIAGSRACGADLPDELAEQRIAMTRAMTPYAPSMKLDFDAGRPLEIAAIYDAPLAAARDAGVEMPAVAAVRDQLAFLEGRYAISR